MKKLLAVIFALTTILPCASVSAQDEIAIKYKGAEIAFNEKSIVMNQRTLVQLRPIAEALELGIEYALNTGEVILSNADSVVVFKQNSDIVNINGYDVTMDVPMIVHNNYSFVPVRSLVEPFGNDIVYDGATKTITISPVDEAEYTDTENLENNIPEQVTEEVVKKEIPSGSGKYPFPFYYQSMPELEFENNGRGYCWVCSYAMLFTGNSQEVITPLDVAGFNITSGFVGNFMAPHETLAQNFGFRFVPAISEDSPYFDGFNLKGRGETTLKITSDEDARAAICEALDKFPGGVLVRYEGYPHSMMAVSYDENNIYFNDPAKKEGEHLTFKETCLTNFALSDISFIQAVEYECL